MLDTDWGSQEVMPAVQKENIPLVPRCGPGAPGHGFSPSWPQVDPDLGRSVSVLRFPLSAGQCCCGFQCDLVWWPFWVSQLGLQCPEARAPAWSQCAGLAWALETGLAPGVPDGPLRATWGPLRGGSSSWHRQSLLLLGHGLGA